MSRSLLYTTRLFMASMGLALVVATTSGLRAQQVMTPDPLIALPADSLPDPATATPQAPIVKKKRVTQKTPAIKVRVVNVRGVALAELMLTSKADTGAMPLRLVHDLAAGKQATAIVPAGSGCAFTISGAYEDESMLDPLDVNLCKDPVIRLME